MIGTRKQSAKFRSLRTRFPTPNLLLLLVLVATVLAFFELSDLQRARSDLRKHLAFVADNQSQILGQAMWNLDRERAELIVRSIMADQDVVGVGIFDEANDLFISEGELPESYSTDSLTATRPIEVTIDSNAENVGSLVIAMSDARLHAHTRQQILIALLLGLAIAIVASVSASIVLQRTIIRPLDRLLVAIKENESGTLREPIAWHGNDELSLVIDAFNRMQEQQYAYEHDLEARVYERRKELIVAHDRVSEAQSQLTDAIESITEGFILIDSDDRLIMCNDQYRSIYRGLEEFLQPGAWIGDFFRAAYERGLFVKEDGQSIEAAIELRIHRYKTDASAVEDKLGDGRWIRFQTRQTEAGHRVGIISDVSERVESDETIRRLATEDTLTGLPNRAQFAERLQEAIAQADRTRRKVGVMLMDLDHFKTVNDTLGHAVGDELLVQVAERLNDCVRTTDIVARLGGDEFAVIVTNIEEIGGVNIAAQKIISELSEPFLLSGRIVHTGTSVGATIYPEDRGSQEQLLGNADLALYKAKAEGRGRLWLFDQAMHDQMRAESALENDLREALLFNQFHMLYQPQIDIRSGEIIGAESLIRWQHPERGLVSPGEFIPVAEKTRQIIDISRWVLHEVCQQIAEWRETRVVTCPVSVNISPLHFRHENLVRDVRNAVDDSGIDPQWLELEITEGMAMAVGIDALATLNELKAMGLGLAVDDFGTGYSSLDRLKEFPIDRLKIDQGFVCDVTTDADDAAICSAVIQLGHTLNLRVIAEGVETKEQLEFLTKMRCDEIQGYLIAKPMQPGVFNEFIETFDPASILFAATVGGGDAAKVLDKKFA